MYILLSLVVYIIVHIYPSANYSQDKYHVRAWNVFNEIGAMSLFNPSSFIVMSCIMLLFISVIWEMYRCSECYSRVIRSWAIITRNCALSFQFCAYAYLYVWVREGHYRTREVASFSGYYQIVAVLQSPVNYEYSPESLFRATLVSSRSCISASWVITELI
jgi:hypothetical protein